MINATTSATASVAVDPTGIRSDAADPGMYPVQMMASPHVQKTTSAVTSYLFGSSGTLERPAWSDSTKGRAIIRTVSRGIVGSLFMAFAGQYVSKKMPNYEPELWQGITKSNFLHTIAYAFDRGPGRLISKIFDPKNAAVFERDAVRFRGRVGYKNSAFPTNAPASLLYPEIMPAGSPVAHLAGKPIQGRSFGSEVVNVTFDFFMASVGDALTRNIIQGFDPNIKQPWILDANGKPTLYGKGEWHWGKFFTHVAKSAWRVVSYNAGEDWAAAIPYVYQMKWQRQILHNHVQPGFKRSADSNINGAVVDLNAHGEVQAKNFQLAGAIDLHGRFVGYNWYTLMYREGYDAVAKAFTQWKDSGFSLHLPSIGNPITATTHLVMDSVRYITKSFIKANIYMNPAMFFFWPMRVSQSAWRGQYSMKMPGDETSQWRRIRTGTGDTYPRARLINDTAWPHDTTHFGAEVFPGNSQPNNPNFFKNIENPYAPNIARSGFDKSINWLGAGSFGMGSALTRWIDRYVGEPGEFSRRIFADTGDAGNLKLGREKLIRNYVDIATSYTPYMWAKAETALRVDDSRKGERGQMDKAIYDLMDHVSTLNVSAAWKDVKHIARLSMSEEREIASREGGAVPDDHRTVGEARLRGDAVLDAPVPDKPSYMVDAKTVQQMHMSTVSNDNFVRANDNPEKKWAKIANAGAMDGSQALHRSS